MRRLIALLIAAAVALTLAGCGGGDEPAPAEEEAAPPPAPPAAPVVEENPDVNAPVEGFPREFGDDVPAQVRRLLDAEQPFIILFYDGEHGVSDDLRTEVDAVVEKYRGLIELVEYALEDDMESVLAGGTFADDMTEDEKVERRLVYLMADNLRVGATPFLVLADREGTITWMYRGYVDRDTLELQVLYATQ